MPPITIVTSARIRIESPMPGVDRKQRSGQRAGERRQRRAEGDHGAKERADVDAHRLDHLGLVGAGAYQHADARVADDEVEAERDGAADDDDDDAIDRIERAGAELDRPREERRGTVT